MSYFGGEGTTISVIHILLSCRIFRIITVRVYEAHAKTCTFLECLLVPYLCVFYCDVVELGSYGNLKYYDTMTEEGKKYFRIVCISFFWSPLSAFYVFIFPSFFLVLFSVSPFFNNSFLHVFIDGAISNGSFFRFFFLQHFGFAISDKEIQWNAFIKEHTCKTTLANYKAEYNMDCRCLFYTMFYNAFKKMN